MADNEIKILKSNTFEEWRQKSNELSLNLGADDRLDSRLTDRIFKIYILKQEQLLKTRRQ